MSNVHQNESPCQCLENLTCWQKHPYEQLIGEKIFDLDELPIKEQPNVSIKTLNKDIYQVPNVFPREQCKEMIDKVNVLNLQFCCYDNKRSNSRLVLFDEAFANHLWDVISKPFTFVCLNHSLEI